MKHWTESEPVRLTDHRRGRVYVAGPMTGIPELNFPAFNAESARLRSEGLTVINPAEHGIVEGAGWGDYLLLQTATNWVTWQACASLRPAAQPMTDEPKAAPKLIGWRTENFLWETDDVDKARNWEPNIGVLPIFEGDPNTKLGSHDITAQGGEGK